MSQAVSAQDTALYISADAAGVSPTNYLHIKEIKSFSREGDRPEIDVTSLDSTAREYRLGLKDSGTMSFEMQAIFDDPGQMALVTALSSPNPYEFKHVYPDGTIDYFQALVKQVNFSGGVDEVLMRQCQIRLTGDITQV